MARKKRSKALRVRRYTRTMKNGRRSSRKFTLPLAVVAGFVPEIIQTVNNFRTGGIDAAGKGLVSDLTGYNPWTKQWNGRALLNGWAPILAGVAVHKIIGGWLGVNRMLAKANVPIIRI